MYVHMCMISGTYLVTEMFIFMPIFIFGFIIGISADIIKTMLKYNVGKRIVNSYKLKLKFYL